MSQIKAASAAATLSKRMTAKKHILVVEDERHLAIGIKFNLEREGYQVTVAGDGPTALKVVENSSEPVDLVVLDLMLPGMSGYAVCESLRSAGEDMPVLILSARTLTEDRTRGFDVGADQYLIKPFDLEELISRVNSLLALYEMRAKSIPKPASNISIYEFGKARINFETHEVTVDDAPLRLTSLELRLLQYFAEHEGRVIPRQELIEKIWGLPGHVNTRAPDQFIRRLRKAFEADPAEPRHFLTIRDTGYRFVARPE